MEGENWVDDGNETSFQKRITEFLRLRWLNKIEKKRANGEGMIANQLLLLWLTYIGEQKYQRKNQTYRRWKMMMN